MGHCDDVRMDRRAAGYGSPVEYIYRKYAEL